MNIDIINDEKSLNINNIDSQNTPSYQGSTMNTLSNRDKKNIKNIIKNHKIQITDEELTSQNLKTNFRINKTEVYDNDKSPEYNLNRSNNKLEDLTLNNFEDTFSKNKLNLKSCINLTNSRSKNNNFNDNSNKNKDVTQHLNSYSNLCNNENSKLNKKHHISRSIDNSITEKANYKNFTGNSIQSTKNLSYSNNKTFTENINCNNSSNIITTGDIEYNLNKSSFCNFDNKNSEKKIYNNLDSGLKKNNKSSYKNNLNLKLNNKNLLKKRNNNNNNKISINISSIQSPDHRATYKIEKIENTTSGEIKYEEFKEFNKKINFDNKKIIELQKCTPSNREKNGIVFDKFYHLEKNDDSKVKKLIFDDLISYNNCDKKNLQINNINNDLNDRIQRAISNSPNRLKTENSSKKTIENCYREICSNSNFKKQQENKSEINKLTKQCFYLDNEVRNNKANKKIFVNSSLNFYNNEEQNIFNYNLPFKNKTIEHDENNIEYSLNTPHKLKLKNQQEKLIQKKYTDLYIKDNNLNTPNSKKSKLRLNSCEILEGRNLNNYKNIICVTENKNENYVNDYNPKLNFLRERYGKKKFKVLIDLLKNSNDINKTINDNEKIKSIVGEDYKIARSFLKNISNEIFPKN